MSNELNGNTGKSYSFKQILYIFLIEKSGVHVMYVLGALIALLIFSITSDFAENSNVVAYISFASTIASLILATFAIFYAVHSNGDISKLFFELRNSSTILQNSSIEIKESSQNLSEITSEIALAMGGLSQKVDEMPKTISDGFNDIKGSMAQFSSEISGPVKNIKDAETFFEGEETRRFISGLVQTPKVYALFVLLSWKSGLRITKDDFKKIFHDELIGLMTFCSVLSTLNLISSSIKLNESGKEFHINVLSVNNVCEEAIFSEIAILFDKILLIDDVETTYVYKTIIKCFQNFDHSLIPDSCNKIAEIIEEK